MKNVLIAWDVQDDTLHFDSIDEPVYVHYGFDPTGLVIGGEYHVAVYRDGDGDLVFTSLIRADNDPLLGHEAEKFRGA